MFLRLAHKATWRIQVSRGLCRGCTFVPDRCTVYVKNCSHRQQIALTQASVSIYEGVTLEGEAAKGHIQEAFIDLDTGMIVSLMN